MKVRNSVLLALILATGICASQLLSANASAFANSSAAFWISVNDSRGKDVVGAKVYMIKNPYDKSPTLVSTTQSGNGGKASFSAGPGVYSIGAYDPMLGWDVVTVTVTTKDIGRTKPVALRPRPLVEKWYDTNGVLYQNPTLWPYLESPTSIPQDLKRQPQPEQDVGFWWLIRRDIYSQIKTKIGEISSVEGLTVNQALKFDSSIETKHSINGGPLSVTGSTGEASADIVNLPPVSNGDSRTTYNLYDYTYEDWGYYWFGILILRDEGWFESKIYAGSATLGCPSPTPAFKSPAQVDDILDSTDTPPSQTKLITKIYSKFEGSGWSVGASASLTGTWDAYSGTVSLGGSYSFAHYSSSETVYSLNLQGGRVVWVYEWNKAGSNAKGIVLTYQNKYWVSSINSYGKTAGGYTLNPGYMVGSSNDGLTAHLHASNYGDNSWIIGNMNRDSTGHIYAYGYSSSGYTSHLVVSVSMDGSSWTATKSQMIAPSSPYFIDCGWSVTYFRYIKFYVDYYNGYSAGLNVDAVHVVNGGGVSFSLREHAIYRPSYSPDIRFLKPSSSVLRIDSYQAGAGSLGTGWAFIVVPRSFLNGKYIRFRWSGYFSYSQPRVVAAAYIYDGEYDHANDADFPEGAGLPLKGAGLLQTLALKNVGGSWGPETVNVLANVASGTQSNCTIFFMMGDGWIQQTVYLDIDWFEINEGAGGSDRFTQNFDADVKMERTGTYGDYGRI